MKIKGVFLPNWLAVFLLAFLALMVYFAVDPVNEAVNGAVMSLLSPVIDGLKAASSLGVM